MFIISSRIYISTKINSKNINYISLFRINDNISINNIVHNHNLNDIDKELLKKVYLLCTEVPLNFMLLDFRSNDKSDRIRFNFLNFINLNNNNNNLLC